VLRPSPDSLSLRLAFTKTEQRTQRLSDGTVVVGAHRFEVPNCYRHLSRLQVRYASWDLTYVHLIDERTGAVLCRLFPQDKTHNARGVRRPLDPVVTRTAAVTAAAGSFNTVGKVGGRSAPTVAPLLSKLLAQQAATGLPPPYLPLPEEPLHTEDNLLNDAGDEP
jgi:putative transposase